MEDLLTDFLAEANDHLEKVERQIVRFEQYPGDAECLAGIFRLVHSLKGASGFLDLHRLERLTHAAETLLAQSREHGAATPEQVNIILRTIDAIQSILHGLAETGAEPDGDDEPLIAALAAAAGATPLPHADLAAASAREPQPAEEIPSDHDLPDQTSTNHAPSARAAPEASEAESAAAPRPGTDESMRPARSDGGSIRVAIGALERIMRLVSELVLTRNQLLELGRSQADSAMSAPLERLSAITTDLQDGVMTARMQPIDRLFANVPRLVRDLARETGKNVRVAIEGSDTELDRQLIEMLRDPLMHLIRNCVDHGIEPARERLAAGKPSEGQVAIAAFRDAGFIAIRITDDGRGIDLQRVRERIVRGNLASPRDVAAMDDDDVCRFIFTPGFSTAEKISHISGRGVGLDVVRQNLETIGGSIRVSTTAGRGSCFELKAPLTLAIVPALIFDVRGQRFAIPQDCVVETLACTGAGSHRIRRTQGAATLCLRGTETPLADFASLCRMEARLDSESSGRRELAIVARIGTMTYAIAVDAIVDVQEIVVTPLCSLLAQTRIFAGSAILGDGAIALILNPAGVAEMMGLSHQTQRPIAAAYAQPREKQLTHFVLFRDGQGRQHGLPLSLLSRIDETRADAIVSGEGQLLLDHNGALMPVVDLAGVDNVGPDQTAARFPVLIAGVGGEPMGLIVAQIVDIVEHPLDIDIAGNGADILGTTLINGTATAILDIAHFMRVARPEEFERRHARRFHVLVVDDKPFFRDMLAPVIAACGYDVNTATSGAEALALLRRSRFDIVLTDIDMPDMNGYELAAAIRETPRLQDMPVLALDAFAGEEVVEAARRAGMIGVVGKFDRKQLLALLREQLAGNAFLASNIEAQIGKDVAA